MMGASKHCGLALLFGALLLLGWTPAAAAADRLRVGAPLCHAVTPLAAKQPSRFACTGQPAGYQHGSLWLRVDPRHVVADAREVTLVVGNSRFDRLDVAFSYGDGGVAHQSVRSGDFGAHWRAGAQIAFTAPERAAPLTGVTLRFDRLAAANLLNVRLIPGGEEEHQFTALATLIGFALTLLLIGFVYNGSLAIASRRQFPAWQAAWAGCMLIWGAVWGQLVLLVAPGMAGAPSAQAATLLACLAITLATFSTVTALASASVPRAVRTATIALGTFIGLAGIPLALVRSGPIEAFADMLGLAILVDLGGVWLCLGIAWRRGDEQARTLVTAWSLPMAVLGAVQFVDVQGMFWGGGSQIIVLFAAAWQTLWLSVATTRSYARLRIERDHALSAEAHAHELARRDALTGLRNRRGFIEEVELLLGRAEDGAVALLLLDVDLFKAVNDGHGHDVGDAVLVAIAARLAHWEGPMCRAARLGGEEFALAVTGLEGFALARFAESVRAGIAACDHRALIGDAAPVTVSIGVAEAAGRAEFRRLYQLADDALYAAKHQGRDRVVLRTLGPEDGDAAIVGPGRAAGA